MNPGMDEKRQGYSAMWVSSVRLGPGEMKIQQFL